ncbi:MAG: hypothetical protein R6X09_08295 [Bacteroidales bacterium]
MKTIDDFIKENLERFNSDGPPEGHFERFEARLQKQEKPESRQIRLVILRIAASILLGLLISYIAVLEFRHLNQRADNMYMSAFYPELKEAESFYNAQLVKKFNEIQELRFAGDDVEKKLIARELSDMNIRVRDMKKDLRSNPEDERIMNAIINMYQLKIELMDMIIARAHQSTVSIL